MKFFIFCILSIFICQNLALTYFSESSVTLEPDTNQTDITKLNITEEFLTTTSDETIITTTELDVNDYILLGRFPFFVSLTTYIGDDELRVCGGFIIEENWILTESYCVQNITEVKIKVGTADFNYPEKNYEGFRFIKHPEYNHASQINNIALIHLPGKIEYNDDVQPISLPTVVDESMLTETPLTVIGVVNDSTASQQPHYLLKWEKFRLINDSECDKLDHRHPNEFCAFETSIHENTNFSNRRFGSGMVYYDDYERPFLMGLENIPSTVSKFPSRFIKISKYIDWIKETTQIGF